MRLRAPRHARIVLVRVQLRGRRARGAGTRRMIRLAARSSTRLQNLTAPGITIPVLRPCRATGFREFS